jgi:hypothetical protein
MSKITKVTFTCDYCHKESDNEEFATNYVQLLTKADGYCEVEKLKVMSFNGDLCDSCHGHILEFLKKGSNQ